STASDADGRYAFADLTPGDYYVVFTAPEGFELTVQSQGSDDAADSDADPVTGATSGIVFTPGDLLLDLDAGLVEVPQIELLGGPEPSTESADFQVNTTTSGFQITPSVARLTDGSFVVVWGSERSNGDDNDPSSVQLQRYASDGSPVGGEQQVNTLTTNSQNRPDVAAAPDGGFWITWESDVSAGDDTSSDSIQLRRFDASGAGVGAEFQVNELTGGSQLSSAIAVAGDGSVLVSWFGASDGSGNSIPARVFDSTGTAVGGQFTVNSFTTGEQYLGEVTALDSGDFLVVWSSPTTSDGQQIIGRRVGTNGSVVGADFQMSENGASYYPAAAPHREG
ncbi:MAG: SdrD B-like domain-containing protein, partial [Acidobacteriota bacterium]